MYRYQIEGKYGAVTDTDTPHKWHAQKIAKILDNEVYLGRTVNCRTEVISFKDKRTRKRPKEKQIPMKQLSTKKHGKLSAMFVKGNAAVILWVK